MNSIIASTIMLFSVIFPSKLWFSPDQKMMVAVKNADPIKLVITDFQGSVIKTSDEITGEKQVDLRELFPQAASGAYIVYAVPKDKQLPDFVGTPLVVNFLEEKRAGAPQGLDVIKVEPLRYAVMSTDAGDMTMAFYYDVAPNTVNNFLTLCEQGFYDDQVFHRIVKGFVIQGGDPLGRVEGRAGTGGPGYTIPQEFNDRQHLEGVLSMARQGDAGERMGNMPGPVAANSASSQFFICLDYKSTRALDKKYTAFGKVTDGMDAFRKIGAVPADPESGKPSVQQNIKKVTVKVVEPGKNPYAKLFTDSK